MDQLQSLNIGSDPTGWQATVCPSSGMNTVSLRFNGQSVLHEPTELSRMSVSLTTVGNQLLFPPNRTAGAKFSFRGESYSLVKNEPTRNNNVHGVLKSVEFLLKSKTDASVIGEYRNGGEVFPFKFLLTVKCSVAEDGYRQSFSFLNSGDKEMPLTFGLHTNFTAPERFAVPIGLKYERNSDFIPTGSPVTLTKDEMQFVTGSPSQGIPISGYYTMAGHTACIGNVLYTASDNFDHWTLYNGGGNSGFISVEPQCGAVNALNSGTGLLSLAPGETEMFAIWIHEADTL